MGTLILKRVLSCYCCNRVNTIWRMTEERLVSINFNLNIHFYLI